MFGWASQTLRNLVVTSFGMKSALWSAADPVRLWREAAQEPAANEGQERPAPLLGAALHESLAMVLDLGCGPEGGVADRRPAACRANSSGVLPPREL